MLAIVIAQLNLDLVLVLIGIFIHIEGIKEQRVNFSGICDGQDGSVKFIIETDEIKP